MTENVRWIIGQIQKERHAFNRTILFEILLKETSRFQIDTHGTKNNGKVFFVAVNDTLVNTLHETCLTTDLSGNLEMLVCEKEKPHYGEDPQQKRWESFVHGQ